MAGRVADTMKTSPAVACIKTILMVFNIIFWVSIPSNDLYDFCEAAVFAREIWFAEGVFGAVVPDERRLTRRVGDGVTAASTYLLKNMC